MAHAVSLEDSGGVLTVDGPSLVSVPSRIGCRNVVRCVGNGTTLSWKRFTRRDILSTEGNRVISVSSHHLLYDVMSECTGRKVKLPMSLHFVQRQ